MLRYLQGAKIGRMGEVSTQSSHFCDFMLYCNDKQCWSVCIANLVHLIDNCGFNYKTYYQMVSALSTFDEWIGTEKCTFQERVPSIDKKHLPYLFLLIPRYVCACYCDDFLSGVSTTSHFVMTGASLFIEDAPKHSNWFWAGIDVLYRHCRKLGDGSIILRLLSSVPPSSPVFAQATKEDAIPIVRITRDNTKQKARVFALFSHMGAYPLLVLYCVIDRSTLADDLKALDQNRLDFCRDEE